jgi:HJR/Mrr/RecB family endonuclease
MGVNMSLKIHFLHSHLDFFRENLGSTSDEQGERFHHDLKFFGDQHKGFWDESTRMLGDYCWSVIRETDAENYKKQSKIGHF